MLKFLCLLLYVFYSFCSVVLFFKSIYNNSISIYNNSNSKNRRSNAIIYVPKYIVYNINYIQCIQCILYIIKQLKFSRITSR